MLVRYVAENEPELVISLRCTQDYARPAVQTGCSRHRRPLSFCTDPVQWNLLPQPRRSAAATVRTLRLLQ